MAKKAAKKASKKSVKKAARKRTTPRDLAPRAARSRSVAGGRITTLPRTRLYPYTLT
jgi:hypothetical protein